MKIVLLGYMGSGKSTVGKRLAEVLEYPFFDLDAIIEQQEEMPISALFSEKGEIYFRKKEASVLQDLLLKEADFILAIGGGTPCYGTIMQQLNAAPELIPIYLKNSLDTLTKRLFLEKEQRPLISHLETEELLNDFIRKHLFERAFYYNQAKVIIDGESLTVNEIVEQLVLKLF